MNFGKLINNGMNAVGRNLPAILVGLGIVGVAGTAFLTGKGALEADKKLKAYEEEQKRKITSRKERAKITYKYYVPAVVAGLGTAVCILFAHKINAQQLATVATVAKTAEKALRENREQVEKVFGEKGLRKVDEQINFAHADEYFNNTSHIYETGHGTVLCCEGFLTGTLFHASPEWIHKCVNDFNARLIDGEQLCYNDFLLMLIPNFDPDLLPDAGWKFAFNLDIKRLILEIVEDSGLINDTKEPYFIFNLRVMPLIDHTAYYQDHLAYA